MAAIEVHARPPVDDSLAAQLAREFYGVETPTVKELGSHQDRNFQINGTSVLKIANRGWARAALESQDAALLHLQKKGVAFAHPVPVPSLNGKLIEEATINGEKYFVRMLTYVEGSPLTGTHYLAPCVVADLGKLAAGAADALADFDHPGLERPLGQWDLRAAANLVTSLSPSIKDEHKRHELVHVTSVAAARVDALAGKLRLRPIHCDVTDDNVVATKDDANRLRPNGVIDFGDLARSWVAAELAVTCSCVLRHPPGDVMSVLPAIKAFHATVPLTDDEISALWPLIVLRGAALVASGEHQALLDPDNPSVVGPLASEWRIFHAAASVPMDVAEACIRAALGVSPAERHANERAALKSAASAGGDTTTVLPEEASVSVVDLSVLSPELHRGLYLEGEAAEAKVLAKAAVDSSSGISASRWGEARLTRSKPHSADAPETVALGVELHFSRAGAELCAPLAGKVHETSNDSRLVLETAAGWLIFASSAAASASVGCSLKAGEDVAAGSVVLRPAAGSRVWFQSCIEKELEPDCEVPRFVVGGALAHGWLTLCPDPSKLLHAETSFAAPEDDPEALLKRRAAHFATVQEHYFASPMRMERGWKHWLLDTSGRSYVDMVNNVAAIGHSHPKLAHAVHQQLNLLNTNSRFHYAAVAELCEQVTALAPKELDTVLLVNSGSEAVDLALRMAQVVTGRMDIIAVREAYHGWTLMSDAVTTSLYDNPRALETRPDWIHLSSAPNSFRGRFRGKDALATGPEGGYAGEMREVVADMVKKGKPPAAFICEPLFGNAGGIVLPEGYLKATYDAVRAAGGLCVADEVQVGYGRTGYHWWAHEAHGVVPDMITIAKAMGNGYPLGAVICRKEISDKFQSLNARFFSSAGGSPASCVAGLSVLKAFREEKLQENARIVGDRIIARCNDMMKKYPMVGAVHGSGLYIGIELVKDRETVEPATAECYAVCDRLRELGCLVQPTGERANILKAKPPMCLSLESADFFCDQLERVLQEGW